MPKPCTVCDKATTNTIKARMECGHKHTVFVHDICFAMYIHSGGTL